MSVAVTIEVEGEMLSMLDDLAERLARPRASLVRQALEEWLAVESENVAAIQRGLAEAEAGIFASDEEVAAVFAKCGVTYGAGR